MATTTAEYITVNVTQEDIDCGTRGSASSCPIAKALRRQLQDNTIYVHVYVAGKRGKTYSMSRRAKKFIIRFDTGQLVTPSTFRLRRE